MPLVTPLPSRPPRQTVVADTLQDLSLSQLLVDQPFIWYCLPVPMVWVVQHYCSPSVSQ